VSNFRLCLSTNVSATLLRELYHRPCVVKTLLSRRRGPGSIPVHFLMTIAMDTVERVHYCCQNNLASTTKNCFTNAPHWSHQHRRRMRQARPVGNSVHFCRPSRRLGRHLPGLTTYKSTNMHTSEGDVSYYKTKEKAKEDPANSHHKSWVLVCCRVRLVVTK
jgi:hypothetical protein